VFNTAPKDLEVVVLTTVVTSGILLGMTPWLQGVLYLVVNHKNSRRSRPLPADQRLSNTSSWIADEITLVLPYLVSYRATSLSASFSGSTFTVCIPFLP
jgi:hypothetical protein